MKNKHIAALITLPLIAQSAFADDGSTGIGVLFILIGICAAFFLYFAPTFKANSVDHHDTTAIFVLNLLLGWAIIPWVIALVWAFKEPPVVVTTAIPTEDKPVVENDPQKACPFCAEMVKMAAIKCRHCGSDLPEMGVAERALFTMKS